MPVSVCACLLVCVRARVQCPVGRRHACVPPSKHAASPQHRKTHKAIGEETASLWSEAQFQRQAAAEELRLLSQRAQALREAHAAAAQRAREIEAARRQRVLVSESTRQARGQRGGAGGAGG